uniref:Ribonuclease H-like domain-containing protein n=1 Tax=Tanacetum cinerariifolium TaxID=118510 RepID=A0A6L2NWX5_TANCI|nr:ribonuclease H-like domain-containing protein [Tanacetum cinerariifolium]
MNLLKSFGLGTACDIQGNVAGILVNASYVDSVAKVNQVKSFKLTENFVIHDVLVVPGYHDSVQKSLMGTGHPADQVLNVAKNKIDLSDMADGPYEVCYKAKETKEPFPLSDYKTTNLGKD